MCLNEVCCICRASNTPNANSPRFAVFNRSDERGKALPFGGFAPRLPTGHGTPATPLPRRLPRVPRPGGRGRGHEEGGDTGAAAAASPSAAVAGLPGPEHARGQPRAELMTAQQRRIPGHCLLINLLIMFCFYPSGLAVVRKCQALVYAPGCWRSDKGRVPEEPRVTWPRQLRHHRATAPTELLPLPPPPPRSPGPVLLPLFPP